MLLLIPLFGLLFLCVLLLKLLGGHIAWWVVWAVGAVFIIPLLILLVLEIYYRARGES